MIPAMVKVDLHTHSQASPDGSLTAADYRRMLETGRLDYIAVTDHNTAEFAIRLKAELGNMGERIIVGEEIRTVDGEIIGLYLTETVPKMLTPQETIAAIRKQGGLVCIPHPFENVRRGMQRPALDTIAADVDIIEVHNGRAVFQNKSKAAYAWAALHGVAGAASSDSHAASGWGRTYTKIAEPPTRDNLLRQLAEAEYATGFPGLKAVLYPKFNRLRGKGKHHV
jgi:predicted metal-dependent phosphoesterase TrpH